MRLDHRHPKLTAFGEFVISLILLTLFFLAIALVADAQARALTPAPPVPATHQAPERLTHEILRRECKPCEPEREQEVIELVRVWHWIGQYYVEVAGLPDFMAWWLPAQAHRESGLGRLPIGDGGLSRGHFHLQEWSIRYWRRVAGRALDRADPVESANALMHAVSWSYRRRVVQTCGEQKSTYHRARLAVARVGRGPNKAKDVPRCDYWFYSRKQGQHIDWAGVTALWAYEWWMKGRG